MRSVQIDCGSVSNWRKKARGTVYGVFIPDARSCPGGLSPVVMISDPGKDDVIERVPEVLSTNGAELTVSVKNDSLVDWQVSAVGKTDPGQILFEIEGEGVSDDFNITGVCPGVTYGGTAPALCRQISVSISDQSRDMCLPELIDGRIDFCPVQPTSGVAMNSKLRIQLKQ